MGELTAILVFPVSSVVRGLVGQQRNCFSREAPKECSPRRQAWVLTCEASQPRGAKERFPGSPQVSLGGKSSSCLRGEGTPFRGTIPTSSSRRPRPHPPNASQNGCGQLHHTRARSILFLHIYSNSPRFWKRIGNHFEFLPIQPDTLAGLVPKSLHASANFCDGTTMNAGHNVFNSTPTRTVSTGLGRRAITRPKCM